MNKITLINNSKIKFSEIKIKRIINTIFKLIKKNKIEINFLFVNNDEIIEYNKKYFKRDCPTDVIAFPFENEFYFYKQNKNKIKYIGDILISLEQVKINADYYKISFEEEFQRVLIHGILHLFGYTDKGKENKKKMFELQEKILKNIKKFSNKKIIKNLDKLKIV
ncbi:MAG TPA: rRNA maturation RNase YbeY [bacterium]|nr:rRNA maturation RNase YbeY [bacterium]HPQ18251.1 rRNA maturation RNase YbeY [bacterium]